MLGVQPYFLLQRFLGLVENFPWKYKLVNIENMPKQFNSEKSYGKWNKTKKIKENEKLTAQQKNYNNLCVVTCTVSGISKWFILSFTLYWKKNFYTLWKFSTSSISLTFMD